MGKSLLAGSLVLFLVTAVTWMMKNPSLFETATLTVGLISFTAAGVLSGAFVSGDKLRATDALEDDKEQRERKSWSVKFFVFGLPCFLAALVSYRYL